MWKHEGQANGHWSGMDQSEVDISAVWRVPTTERGVSTTACNKNQRGGARYTQTKNTKLHCAKCDQTFKYNPELHISDAQRKHHLSNRKIGCCVTIAMKKEILWYMKVT